MPTSTILDKSSGAIDWADVVKVGFLYHRLGTATTAARTFLRDLTLYDKTVLIGGCNGQPITPIFAARVISGWGMAHRSSVQGKGQVLLKSRIQYGDGVNCSRMSGSAMSYELPSGENAEWRVLSNNALASFSLKTSDADTVKMTAKIMATDRSQSWIIDPASSPLATYNFNGLTLAGWVVSNNAAGVTMNGVVFSACRGITLNGGSLRRCTIDNSETSPAVVTNDPGKIELCDFISAGTGHAIEITAAGTYTFSGNTFADYGADGSTDAAIYNNSGGAVTLEIPAGGQMPTIRNGAGASTTIDSPALQVTLQAGVSLAGAIVNIYEAADPPGDFKGTLLFGTQNCPTATYSFEVVSGMDVIIQIIKSGYQEYVQLYTTPAVSTTLPIRLSVEEFE